MPPYRLAAMDLDDTLLGKDKTISAENFAAVQALKERGVRVVLASGRKHESMLPFHRQLGLDGPVVSCQGALVKNADTQQVLHEQLVPADLAAELVAHALGEGATLAYYHADGIFVTKHDALTRLYQSRGGDPIIEFGDLNQLAGQRPLKIIWLDHPERTASRLAQARERYQGQFELVVTSPEYLEFNAFGISKSVGLNAVIKHYGISRTEVLTFGDGDNDVSMLEWAGHGVAMSHATPKAKAAAAWVAPDGPPETCLARAVRQILKDHPH